MNARLIRSRPIPTHAVPPCRAECNTGTNPTAVGATASDDRNHPGGRPLATDQGASHTSSRDCRPMIADHANRGASPNRFCRSCAGRLVLPSRFVMGDTAYSRTTHVRWISLPCKAHSGIRLQTSRRLPGHAAVECQRVLALLRGHSRIMDCKQMEPITGLRHSALATRLSMPARHRLESISRSACWGAHWRPCSSQQGRSVRRELGERVGDR